MRVHRNLLTTTLSTAALVITAAWSDAQTPRHHGESDINKPFQNPDVKEFIKKFESDTREVYAKRAEIVRSLELKPGMAVADVGAGTGLFTRLFADAVGPKGAVYAADISPAFLKHIAAEAKRLGHENVRTIQCTQESTGLAPRSIDVAFVCDVYHHFERPSKSLAEIRRALRPGGRLVVVDYDRENLSGKDKDFLRKHLRAGKDEFIREIESEGFRRENLEHPPRLRENFFASFRVSETPASEPTRRDR